MERLNSGLVDVLVSHYDVQLLVGRGQKCFHPGDSDKKLIKH